MLLRYPPFAACEALEKAARNAPPLRQGARGPAVAVLQAALLQLGEKLPHSMKAPNVPSGFFTADTAAAVRSFQARAKLVAVDGVVGRETMGALDAQMLKLTAAAPPAPPAPVPVVLPSTAHYEVGTGDPPLKSDPGAGAWGSKPWEVSYAALREAILEALPGAALVIGVDAAKHMAHYMGNTGGDYTIDLEAMVREVPSARAGYEDEVVQVRQLVERLPPGRHLIRSRMAESGYNKQSENRNWFFAIGGYSRWGQGVATVKGTPLAPEYEVDFEYKFYDRYNWDNGKSVTIAGITVTDESMGEFHRQGLAKEFDCHGTFKRRLAWKKGDLVVVGQLAGPGWR